MTMETSEKSLYELRRQKPYIRQWASNEDLDQSAHAQSDQYFHLAHCG